MGIGHVKIRPRTPRLNGEVERSHHSDSDEFYRLLDGEVIDDANLSAERLRQWEDRYPIDPTAPSRAKRPTNASSKKHETRCHRPLSVAQPGHRRGKLATRSIVGAVDP